MNPSLEDIAKNEALLKTEIGAKQELLRAYEMVRKDLEEKSRNGTQIVVGAMSTRTRTRVRIAPPPGTYGRVLSIIRSTLRSMPEQFTIQDMADRISHFDISKMSVTTAFNSLRKRGEIAVKEKGGGRKPTIFQRA